MTVIFVAPDESDEEELANCEENNHLKYKFITDENSMKNLTLSEGENSIDESTTTKLILIFDLETVRP